MQADTLTRAVRIAAVGVGLVLLLAIVAAATQSGFGHSGDHGTASHTLVSYGVTAFLVLLIMLIPVAIYFRLKEFKESIPENPNSLRRVVRGLVGVAVALAFGFLISKVWPHLHPLHHPPRIKQPAQIGKGTLKSLHNASSSPTFEWPVFWVALVIAMAATGVVIYRIRTRQPLPEFVGMGLEDDLAASISDAIDDLEREPDARRAVIAAYARMERVLGRHGLKRRLSETPIEYLRRVLNDVSAHGEAVSRLTSLFERAKFSSHPIGDEAKREAIDSLRQIRDGIV